MRWCCTCGLQTSDTRCPRCGCEQFRDAYGRVVAGHGLRRATFPKRLALVTALASISAAAAVFGGVGGLREGWLGTFSAAARAPVSGDAFGTGRTRPNARPRATASPRPKPPAPPSFPRIPGRPPPGVEAADRPLGRPQPPPPGTESYSFVDTQPRSEDPVTWDPCRPIHYVVHGSAPAAARRALTSGLQELSRVTGLSIRYDGTSSERPSLNRGTYLPSRYGRRWAPVLISWSDPQESPSLAGGVIGYAQAFSVTGRQGHQTYVSGEVTLDTPFFAALAASGSRRQVALMRAVVMHEMTHVLGLGHVYEADQIMYPEAQLRVHDLGDGDRRGLYRLARGACAPEL